MTTGPRAGEHKSDTPDVTAKQSPTPEVTDTKPEAGSESPGDLSKEPIRGPKRWQDTSKRLRTWLSNPPWWFQQVFVAILVGLIVGGFLAAVNAYYEQIRSDRDHEIADQQRRSDREIADQQRRAAIQLENLRYVRQQSSIDFAPRRFAELNLERADLAELELRGADFYQANLRSANLSDADLGMAPTGQGNLYQISTIVKADLTGANLGGASLVSAAAEEAILSNADLTDAILCNVSFQHANLHNANLTGANLSGRDTEDIHRFGYPLNFDGSPADLSNANLSGANLTDANLAGTILTNIFYDGSTKWPPGFHFPPSRANR